MERNVSLLFVGIAAVGLIKAAEAAPSQPGGQAASKYPHVFFKPPASIAAHPLADSELCRSLEWKGVAVAEPDRCVFCCCPIEGPEGKIHMFAARGEPGAAVEPTWGRTNSIAHYVADKPEGPFRYVATVLEGTKDGAWDSYAPENPDVRKIDGKYVMVYTGTRDAKWPYANPNSFSVGMAIATDLNGPWRRAGEIFDPRTHPNPVISGCCVVNPTILARQGKYFVYFKAGPYPTAKYFVAIADKLEGPYAVRSEPVTDNPDYIEDAFVWEQDGVVYLMTTDCDLLPDGHKKPNLLWHSKDGLHFKFKEATNVTYGIMEHYRDYDLGKAKNRYGGNPIPFFADPAFLLQNGRPTYFYAPSNVNVSGGKYTEIYCMKVHFQDPSKVAGARR